MVKEEQIKTIIEDILTEKELKVIKCHTPKYCSKPTKEDLEFINDFFYNHDGEPPLMNNFEEGDELNHYEDSRIQREYDDNVGFTENEIETVEFWGDTGYLDINGKIYNTSDYRGDLKDGLVNEEEVDEQIETLQSAIDNSPNIEVDRIMYSGRHWVKSIKDGDVVTQKGFSALSYSKKIGKTWMQESDTRYLVRFFVPTGTKGVWLGEPFEHVKGELEYLTGMGTRYYVFGSDPVHKTVNALILPPPENEE